MRSQFCLKRRLIGVCVIGLTWIGCGGPTAIAQTSAGSSSKPADAVKEFPSEPAMWVNSEPLSVEALKGKGAFVWFYEEGCPRCREKWPEMLATAKKYEGKPVVFIAVNSGTSRNEVENYAQSTGLNWPILVDTSREFEKQSGVSEISLQNIYQLGIISPDGSFSQANAREFGAAAERAAAGAKWTVDPTGMPAALMPAWTAIEMGDFAAAATLVKKGLATNKPEIKEAVELAFAVKVESVNTTMAHGKSKRTRQGRMSSAEPPVFKKAMVTIAPGQTIEFFEGV